MQPNLETYSSFFFDCDGVILNSNAIKSEAFAQAVSDEPAELVSEFVRYHQTHGGVSRYVKFNYFYRDMKKDNRFEEKSQAAIRRYSQIVSENLKFCPEIPGAIELLEKLTRQQKKCFVISGGDQDELREVFRHRKLDGYFTQILGSPKTKKEHLQTLKEGNLISVPGIYFGDAKADFEAALAYDLDFIFISGCSEWADGLSFCTQHSIPVLSDFTTL